jgi:cellulose synthase/poly-beta-1,6-N-acetylglucosamine synthase-like glycosyltransferase
MGGMLEVVMPGEEPAARGVSARLLLRDGHVPLPQASDRIGGAGVWRPVIEALSLDGSFVRAISGRAGINGTSFQAELLASGEIGETAFFQQVAATLGLPFLWVVDPDALIMRDHDGLSALRAGDGVRMARLRSTDGQSLIVVAPREQEFIKLKELLERKPELALRLRITMPSVLRRAVEIRCQPLLGRRAISHLFDTQPYNSARMVVTGWQGFLAGILLGLSILLLGLAPTGTLIGAHVFFSLFFLSCVVLRLLAVRHVSPGPPVISALRPKQMPRYSVLVALYDEAEIVPELLVALGKLIWPRGKLEIKLVCEADDRATIDAIRAQDLRPLVEVIEVPKGLPRTKPRALAYALQMVSGDFVALYDAEDRPHPMQLVEAWQRFQASDSSLACVQAPLTISNRRRSMLARMFAFEYSGLFKGMLPFLSRNELILPLGGTSNHFRRDILDTIGGWDPFNVTEDADLGLRLKRFGYRTETISLPTEEIAPETLSEWLPQRTRWFKGWIQTWLVHMRDPRRLLGELGVASFLVSQILFAGMIVSALAHPLLLMTLVFLLVDLIGGHEFSVVQSALLGIDLTNIVLGYAAFLLLGRSTLAGSERRHLLRIVLFTPVYWMLLSVAAWRAVWQLKRDPYLWEKTPHPVGRAEETGFG